MKLTTNRFKLAEAARVVHRITPEHGTTFEQILAPVYWAHVAAKLHVGDHIEVLAEDGSYFAELIVLRTDKLWAKVATLRKVDLTGTPEVNPAEFEEFYVKWGGPIQKFRIHRRKDKEVIKSDFETAEAAHAWLADYRKALAA